MPRGCRRHDAVPDGYALGVNTSDTDPLVGRLVDGRYEVLSTVARGGMATVYLANDRRLQRRIALKVISPHLADGTLDPEAATRFRDEARAAARLSHPGIVAVHDQGEDGDLSYLTMEYVPGTNLRRVMSDAGALSVGDSLELLDQILGALAGAHAAGLVHRDVKPENVLIDRDGRVRVADFGLARAAHARPGSPGSALGTVAYMAPEVINGKTVDASADVYSVGVLAFEMLTGRQPYAGTDAREIAARHVSEDVPAPSGSCPALAAPVDAFVEQLTARDAASRPSDATVALAALRRLRSQLSADELAVRAAVDPGTAEAPTNGTRVLAATSVLDPTPAAAPASYPAGRRTAHPSEDATTLVEAPTTPRPGRSRLARPLTWALVALLILMTGGLTWWFVSGPGATRAVPDGLVGVSSDAAVEAIQASGLEATTVEEYDDDVAAGHVVGTDPDGGTRVDLGGTVTLTVSLGPDTATVPDGLVGASEDAATESLRDAGFDVAESQREADPAPEGEVVAVSVEEGSTQPVGTTVTLTVSDGPDEVTVPRVVGDDVEDARAELEDAGFTVEVNEVLGAFLGVVVAQDPNGGESLESGGTITLDVA